MGTVTAVRSTIKPQLDGKVVSNDGDIAVVQYKDGESRAFERFLGREELRIGDKVFQEAEPATTVEEFRAEMPVGARVRLNWRPTIKYGMRVDGPNCTRKMMTVGDLIRELQALPSDALALISSDEEGNQFKHLYNVLDGVFGEDEDHADDDRFEDHGLKVGDKYVIIWPHL
jgi:hypothetical protein